MNPSQYYPYQLAASASMQGLPPGYTVQPPFVHHGPQLHVPAGGVHVTLPPPPPTVGAVLPRPQISNEPDIAVETSTTATIKEIISEETEENKINEEIEEPKENASVESDVKTIVAHSTYSKPDSQPSNLPSLSTTTTAVAGTVPTPMVMPPNPAGGLIGGVYAGAYIQQSIPQSIGAATTHHQPQLMAMATAGFQPTISAHTQPASKLMYLPQTPTVQANPYASMMQPTLVMDQTGKTYIMNQPAPVQYQMAAHAGIKAAPGHQYMLAQQPAPQLYTTLQAQASAALQGATFARYPAPTGYSIPGAVPGINPVPGAQVGNQQLYYYYT